MTQGLVSGVPMSTGENNGGDGLHMNFAHQGPLTRSTHIA